MSNRQTIENRARRIGWTLTKFADSDTRSHNEGGRRWRWYFAVDGRFKAHFHTLSDAADFLQDAEDGLNPGMAAQAA